MADVRQSGAAGDDVTVLVVEQRAHEMSGHLANRFAELADGLVAAGARVEVLTSAGWAGDAARAAWPVHRYTRTGRRVFALSERGRRRSRVVSAAAKVVRSAVLVAEVRRRVSKTRRAGAGRVGVVVVSMDVLPSLAGLFGGRAAWVQHLSGTVTLRSRVTRAADRFRAIAARRGRTPTAVTIAVPTPTWERLGAPIPTFRVVHVPLAGTRPVVEVRDARARLGLAGDRPLALLFGSNHSQHATSAVAEAFRGRTDWRLAVGGRAVDGFVGRATGGWAVPPVLLNAAGEYAPAAVRELAYEACDLVVLSFTDGYALNSGTLMDAASHGRPVLVSSGSAAAELVVAMGAGEVFTAGSGHSLADALARIDLTACRSGMEALRVTRSNEAVARAHLAELFPPAP